MRVNTSNSIHFIIGTKFKSLLYFENVKHLPFKDIQFGTFPPHDDVSTNASKVEEVEGTMIGSGSDARPLKVRTDI
jgi:hypothetical protein